jgi:hypothetical protein
MTAPHFLVFVGAGPSLSTELNALRPRFEGITVVAPAMGKHERGMTVVAIQRAVTGLVEQLRAQQAHREPARLSVWSYEPADPVQFSWLWQSFGKSAWIELVPAFLKNKDRQTRLHIQTQLDRLVQLVHLIAHNVYNERKTSPLSLPFRNFRHRLPRELAEYWYRDADATLLKRVIEKNVQRFRQLRIAGGAHRDDRSLLFTAARDGACHGLPHPTGDSDNCYIEGRFRFGAALFPGFHYDVRPEAGLLECTLYDCRGVARDLKPERRGYINIFPNDHMLPERR